MKKKTLKNSINVLCIYYCIYKLVYIKKKKKTSLVVGNMNMNTTVVREKLFLCIYIVLNLKGTVFLVKTKQKKIQYCEIIIIHTCRHHMVFVQIINYREGEEMEEKWNVRKNKYWFIVCSMISVDIHYSTTIRKAW